MTTLADITKELNVPEFPTDLEDFAIDIGANIAYARIQRSYSQEELASRLGVTVGYLSSVERGSRLPTLKFLFSVAWALEMNIAAPVFTKVIKKGV